MREHSAHNAPLGFPARGAVFLLAFTEVVCGGATSVRGGRTSVSTHRDATSVRGGRTSANHLRKYV